MLVLAPLQIPLFFSFAAHCVHFHRFLILLFDDGLQFLFLFVFLMPECIGLLILTLDEQYVLILLLDSLTHYLFFVFVVYDVLLVSDHPFLELPFSQPHLRVAVWQKVL